MLPKEIEGMCRFSSLLPFPISPGDPNRQTISASLGPQELAPNPMLPIPTVYPLGSPRQRKGSVFFGGCVFFFFFFFFSGSQPPSFAPWFLLPEVSVVADTPKLEPDIEDVNFLPTAMFCSKADQLARFGEASAELSCFWGSGKNRSRKKIVSQKHHAHIYGKCFNFHEA